MRFGPFTCCNPSVLALSESARANRSRTLAFVRGRQAAHATQPSRRAKSLFLLLSFLFCSTGMAQSSLPSDSQVDTGTHPFGTYNGTHDKVSLVSGNLSFCIPLVSLPGLIKHGLTIPLCYNSQYAEPYIEQGRTSGMNPVVSWFPWVW